MIPYDLMQLFDRRLSQLSTAILDFGGHLGFLGQNQTYGYKTTSNSLSNELKFIKSCIYIVNNIYNHTAPKEIVYPSYIFTYNTYYKQKKFFIEKCIQQNWKSFSVKIY